MHENDIGTVIVDCAVRLHQELGPGLMESVYEFALARRLAQRGLRVQRQAAIPIEIDGLRFDEGFRADLVVERRVLVELKCVERSHPAHKKQLLTYLKLSGRKLGYARKSITTTKNMGRSVSAWPCAIRSQRSHPPAAASRARTRSPIRPNR